jgi:hypothetical protein
MVSLYLGSVFAEDHFFLLTLRFSIYLNEATSPSFVINVFSKFLSFLFINEVYSKLLSVGHMFNSCQGWILENWDSGLLEAVLWIRIRIRIWIRIGSGFSGVRGFGSTTLVGGRVKQKETLSVLFLLYPVRNPAAKPISGTLVCNVHTSVADPDPLVRDPDPDPSISKQ